MIPTTHWRPLIDDLAPEYPPIDPVVFEAMVLTESNGDPFAQSASDARGLAQVMYRWHAKLVEEVAAQLGHGGGAAALFNPEICLRVGMRHLAWCYTADDSAKRSWERAIRKYHLGSYDPPKDEVDGQGTSSDKHIEKYRANLARVKADRGSTQEFPTMKPYILLVAGHNSVGDPGNPVERGLTDDLARSYKKFFREAGFQCDILQEIDGDNLPMSTTGGLSRVASVAGQILMARPEKYSIMFDLHFNTARSAVHAVAPHVRRPNGTLLSSGFSGGSPANDTLENNTRDVALGSAWARNMVSDIPGMTLYGSNGIMSEVSTNVGSQGYRLGMFGGTAKARHKAVRLVLEHGGTNDASKPVFFDKSAKAALRAVNTVFADVIGTTPDPDVEEPPVEIPDDIELTFAPGMSAAAAVILFGKSSDAQGTVYEFNPTGTGVVSKVWNDYGKETGRYPHLEQVFWVGTAKYFQFSDGLIIWTPKDGVEPVRIMEGVTP